jgi:hypothetical protein
MECFRFRRHLGWSIEASSSDRAPWVVYGVLSVQEGTPGGLWSAFGSGGHPGCQWSVFGVIKREFVT